MHVPPQIMKLGRITPWVDPSLSEEAKQAKLDELNEQDPEFERLKGINEDRRKSDYRSYNSVGTIRNKLACEDPRRLIAV